MTERRWAEEARTHRLDSSEMEEPSENDKRHRQYLAWGVATYPGLSGSMKTLLRVIGARVGPYGEPAMETLAFYAGDSSLQLSSVYRLLKQADQMGIVEKEPLSEEERFDARRSEWSHGKVGIHKIKLRTYPFGEAKKELNRLWLTPKEEAPFVEIDVHRDKWEKRIRMSNLSTATKGVALAAGLLTRRNGFPIRTTTIEPELCFLSGYGESTVRRALAELEELRWIEVERRRGRGGGLSIRLRYTRHMEEEIRVGR